MKRQLQPRVKCKQSNSSEQSSIRLCRAAGLVRHSKVEVSAAAEPPTWSAEHILCCRPEDLFWEGFMFVCLLEMKCTMTQICLWSLVTSDVWIRDWCLSASGCPARKERLCCCPWKKKIHTGNMGNIWTFVLWSCFPCLSCFYLHLFGSFLFRLSTFLSVLWLFLKHLLLVKYSSFLIPTNPLSSVNLKNSIVRASLVGYSDEKMKQM